MREEDQEYRCSTNKHGSEHQWTAPDRAITSRMVQKLENSESEEVDTEELEDCLLGPNEFDVARQRRKALKAFPRIQRAGT